MLYILETCTAMKHNKWRESDLMGKLWPLWGFNILYREGETNSQHWINSHSTGNGCKEIQLEKQIAGRQSGGQREEEAASPPIHYLPVYAFKSSKWGQEQSIGKQLSNQIPNALPKAKQTREGFSQTPQSFDHLIRPSSRCQRAIIKLLCINVAVFLTSS